MSIWSSLLDTYKRLEAHGDLGDGSMTPFAHMTMTVMIDVIITPDGEPVRVEQITELNRKNGKPKKGTTIVVPCTTRSQVRVTRNQPHPLCDRLSYVDKKQDREQTETYLKQLAGWKDGNLELEDIYNYVNGHSITDDAEKYGVKITGDPGIRFTVTGLPGGRTVHVDEDPVIRDRWIRLQNTDQEVYGIDQFGEPLTEPTYSTRNQLLPGHPQAKLISVNSQGPWQFQYRGRFASKKEALSIDRVSEYRIFAALEWLIKHNSMQAKNGQMLIVWSIEEPQIKPPSPLADSDDASTQLDDFLSAFPENSTENDRMTDAEISVDTDYARRFARLLQGRAGRSVITSHRRISLAILEANVLGRAGIVYYRELRQNEFLEDLLEWHTRNSWHLIHFWKDDKGEVQTREFTGAPSCNDILRAAYGPADADRMQGEVRRRLTECMFDDRPLPNDILEAAYRRAVNPDSFKDIDAWDRSAAVTCALWRGYYNHHERKINMELDKERTDRDYLYGRLLALADNLEYSVLVKQGNGKASRATNAVKLMTNYAAKPYHTWGVLSRQITPYLKALNGAPWYQNNVDEVMSLFRPGEFENNNPLAPLYLLGYSHERRFLMESAKRNQDNAKRQGNEAQIQETIE
ncbi:hypothetical protein COO72_02340 [Bifidobacterium callitrichos]|nr:hypothetical protein COO72_02340 [Bifidobacterium callitrichos]